MGGVSMLRMNVNDIAGMISGIIIIIAWGVLDYISTKNKK
jgi:hypothetical protein